MNKDLCYRIFIWSLIVLWLLPLGMLICGVFWWIMSGDWVLTTLQVRYVAGVFWTVVGFVVAVIYENM